MSQLKLLPDRRFWPLFWTQFLGAFNDNLFKNALVILITYRAWTLSGMEPAALVAASAGLFILPYFLMSATAGQIADRFRKSRLIKWVKVAEVVVMALAALGFFLENLPLLLGVLFLMGLQSTFFGPAKYAVLPELLDDEELVGGNALVETGTFIAILLGTIAGGVLAAGEGTTLISVAVVVVALAGAVTSRAMRPTPEGDATLKVNLDPVRPTLQTFAVTKKNRPVFLSILGISWFWFFGASLLTLLPTYGKDVLHGSELVVTFLLGLFCVGIALGSLLCERMSRRTLELGLVPLGSIGISLFSLDLFFAGAPEISQTASAGSLALMDLIQEPAMWRIIVDFTMISVFSGFYTVPLYTMLQQRSEPEIRSRVIAANNILNAAFMVVSAGMLIGLSAAGVDIYTTFLILSILNGLVAGYIYTLLPEFLLRFAIWVLARVLYRVDVENAEHIPAKGGALVVANHVTFVDWLLIQAVAPRPLRFVMYHEFFKIPVLGYLFRSGKVIPIAPAHESQEVLDAAFDRIDFELNDGDAVCIFPEGKLTSDGRLNPFRTGVDRILARTAVPVVPISISGLWGSFFSKSRERGFFKRFRSRIVIKVGDPIAPEDVTAQRLAEEVAKLGGWDVPDPAPPAGSAPTPAKA